MLAYVIRHAESQFNVDPAAGLNSSLTPRGFRQAAAVARRLKSVPISAVYTSPFDRCLQTAAAVVEGRPDIPVFIRPELWEYHHVPAGSHVETGLGGIETITARFGFAKPCPDYRTTMTWPAVDEPRESMLARTRAMAEFLKARWTGPDDTIVVISHGSPIARLIEAWLTDTPGPSFRFVIENAALTALRHEPAPDGGSAGTRTLICLNEISHLQDNEARPVSHDLLSPTSSNFNADGTVKPRRASSYW